MFSFRVKETTVQFTSCVYANSVRGGSLLTLTGCCNFGRGWVKDPRFVLFSLFYQRLENEVSLDRGLYSRFLSYVPNPNFSGNSEILLWTENYILWSYKDAQKLIIVYLLLLICSNVNRVWDFIDILDIIFKLRWRYVLKRIHINIFT